MARNIPLEFQDILADRTERDEIPECEVAKFFQDAEFAVAIGRDGDRHLANFRAETAGLDAEVADHYRKIAEAAARQHEAEAAFAKGDGWDEEISADPLRLEKRATPDVYREYLAAQIAKGMTADEAVEKWCSEFPNHRPEVADALREAAAAL